MTTAATNEQLDGRRYDLVIVGAGLVGASLACYLAQHCPELDVLLLDGSETPEAYTGDSFDPRVVALSPGSQALFEALGVWPTITASRACPYQHMHVWDAEGTSSIGFSSDDLHLPALGHIVENSVAVRALHQRLKQQAQSLSRGGVTCAFGKRLSQFVAPAENAGAAIERQLDNRVQLVLESGEHLSAQLMIAADGATSRIRELANFRTREWNYGHTAIVTTVRTERDHQFTAWQRFQTSGPIAFLPLQQSASAAMGQAGSHYSSIVWSLVSDQAEAMMQLDDAGFCRALGDAFEQRLGAVEWADTRVAVPLRQRHAVRYWQPHIALVGDAAHSLHPLAGQGVNLGLRDARVLGEEIVRAGVRGFPLTDVSLLKRYERRRQVHNLAAMATMEGFKRLFGAEDPAVRWLRNAGMAFVNEQTWLKRRLAAMAIE